MSKRKECEHFITDINAWLLESNCVIQDNLNELCSNSDEKYVDNQTYHTDQVVLKDNLIEKSDNRLALYVFIFW